MNMKFNHKGYIKKISTKFDKVRMIGKFHSTGTVPIYKDTIKKILGVVNESLISKQFTDYGSHVLLINMIENFFDYFKKLVVEIQKSDIIDLRLMQKDIFINLETLSTELKQLHDSPINIYELQDEDIGDSTSIIDSGIDTPTAIQGQL